jgi:hypothetical protein
MLLGYPVQRDISLSRILVAGKPKATAIVPAGPATSFIWGLSTLRRSFLLIGRFFYYPFQFYSFVFRLLASHPRNPHPQFSLIRDREKFRLLEGNLSLCRTPHVWGRQIYSGMSLCFPRAQFTTLLSQCSAGISTVHHLLHSPRTASLPPSRPACYFRGRYEEASRTTFSLLLSLVLVFSHIIWKKFRTDKFVLHFSYSRLFTVWSTYLTPMSFNWNVQSVYEVARKSALHCLTATYTVIMCERCCTWCIVTLTFKCLIDSRRLNKITDEAGCERSLVFLYT